MLALFCYRRSHMQDLALAIASTCELRDLVQWGGALGSAIYAMAQQSVTKPAPSPNKRPPQGDAVDRAALDLRASR